MFGIGAGLVLVVGVAIIGRRALAAAGAGLQTVNPLNPNNAIAAGVNRVGEVISNTPSWSLGAWVWELTHPEQRAAEQRATGPSGATGSW